MSILILKFILLKKAGFFAIIVLHMYYYYKCSVALPHSAWAGLRYVIVVFPDHTHLLLFTDKVMMFLSTEIYN